MFYEVFIFDNYIQRWLLYTFYRKRSYVVPSMPMIAPHNRSLRHYNTDLRMWPHRSGWAPILQAVSVMCFASLLLPVILRVALSSSVTATATAFSCWNQSDNLHHSTCQEGWRWASLSSLVRRGRVHHEGAKCSSSTSLWCAQYRYSRATIILAQMPYKWDQHEVVIHALHSRIGFKLGDYWYEFGKR